MAVLGLTAPALSDSLHPSFYMALLVLGGQAKVSWEPPARPLVTRFQYSLLDDPGFARFYPAVESAATRRPAAARGDPESDSSMICSPGPSSARSTTACATTCSG